MSPSPHATLQDPRLEGFAIETVEPTTVARLRRVVNAVLKTGWRVEAFGERGTDFQVVPNRPVSQLSTAEAWERTYELRRRPGILYAEPLFLVTVPDEEDGSEGGGFEGLGGREEKHLPGSDPTGWSADLVRAREAWSLFKEGHVPGAGVVVGHPDTGYRRHREIAENLLIEKGRDFIDADADAEDDLRNPGHVIIHNPGHGTATASVIVSPTRAVTGAEDRDVVGIAPGARLIPLRVARTVVLVSTLNLARAIEHAADQGAHVVSISMGGLWSARLRKAVLYAQRKGVIILAAAGNKVRFVVWPAAYEEVVAVAACNVDRRPWSGSSRGGAVDVTGPGESVWRARTELLDGGGTQDSVSRGSGTSYAVATVAGVAALWLSFHNRDALVKRYGAEKIPFIFSDILRSTAVPQAGLGRGFGRGLVDAHAVLTAPLPAGPDEGLEGLAFTPPPGLEVHPPLDNGGLATFAHLLGSSLADSGFESAGAEASPAVGSAIAGILGTSRDQLPARLREIGQELAFHVATDPELYRQVEALLSTNETLAPGDPARARETLLSGDVSVVLKRRLESAVAAPVPGPDTAPEVPPREEEDEDACGLDEGVRQGGAPPPPAGAPGSEAPSPPPQGSGPIAAALSPGGSIQIRITRDEVQISIDPGALGRAPAPAAGAERRILDEAGASVESIAAEELETTDFVGLASVPADKLGQGFESATIRADLKEPYLSALRQVRALGGILTSSGGIRDLGTPATPGRSRTSLHYTGRAIDLFIHTGMRGPNDRYGIVRDGGSDSHPLWKVYCLSQAPNTAAPLFDASLVRELELDCAVWRQNQMYTTVKRRGKWICLTDVLAGHGWNRIPARSDWRANYLSVEWWHFQHHQGLIVGQSRFGPELKRAWPAAKVEASGLALNAVWSGLSFKAPA